MIAKTCVTNAQRFVSYFNSCSKPKQIAITALALFTVSLIALCTKPWLSRSFRPLSPTPPMPIPKYSQKTSSFISAKLDVREELIDGYPSKLVKSFEKDKEFNKLPVLNIEGFNCTCDQIDPNVITGSVMKGKDSAGRPFLACKYRLNSLENTEICCVLAYDFTSRTWYLNQTPIQTAETLEFWIRLLVELQNGAHKDLTLVRS
jgi:hypothetical protein